MNYLLEKAQAWRDQSVVVAEYQKESGKSGYVLNKLKEREAELLEEFKVAIYDLGNQNDVFA
jgi:hypothetical protein